MKKTAIILSLLFVFLIGSVSWAQLKVDFNSNQDGGGDSSAAVDPGLSAATHNQAGWSSYHANHEAAAEFSTADYGGITVTPTWSNTSDNRVRQSIDRGSGNDATWNDSAGYLNLVTDWIGIDTRTGNGGNGNWDGSAGVPTYMELVIGGLDAGSYDWTSFHHDTENVHCTFAVWLSTDGGSSFTRLDDGLMTDGTEGGDPESPAREHGPDVYLLASTYNTTISANGTDDVVMRFAPYSGVAVHRQIWGMNGFELKINDPCFNGSPSIQAPNSLVVNVNEPTTMEITATDDGKPYIEGCNPDDPQTGTSYDLQYQWSQLSGPAPVIIDPVSADIENPTFTFGVTGTYELLLQVSDAPVDGKTSEITVTVDALLPLAGDFDGNGTVNSNDLLIFANQWLDSPPCVDLPYCADLDASGSVTTEDFAMMSPNWLIDSSKVIINEFLASNRQGLTDGDGNTSDWIELYNPDTKPVSLEGWYLTDERGVLNKWAFPSGAVVSAEGYMVVFASDRDVDDYVDGEGNYHTNFAIDRGGEYLALVAPGNRIVHEYTTEFPPQVADISYGMWHSMFRYFAQPTPGQANQQEFLGFTDKTAHSHKRGFYDEPLDVHIYCDTPGAIIRYTVDGSEPTEQNGLLYDPNTTIAVTTTTHVRSVAFKPSWRPGNVTTHSYIFVDDVAKQPANPAGWPLSWGYEGDAGAEVPADYEMDQRVVNNTLPGYSIRDALLDIPTMSISMYRKDFITNHDTNGIYSNSQERWERKCSIEYILPDGTDGFQEDCKIEVHGNASRRPARMQKHSLRLTFTSLYGSAKLKYPLFDDSNVDTFNQLVIRASFTDSWGLVSWSDSRYRPNDSQYIRDVWMKESLADMGQPSSHGNFVHLYVNGLYFGVHNLSERLAGDFFADHYGGEPEDWEINEDFSTPRTRWNTMMSINPSTIAGYTQIQDYLDVENFADYMILHFYGDSEDWPHHNGYAASNSVSGDGKIRFFVWDQEIVLDYHNRASARINHSGGAGAVFQKMRTSEEFRLLFADRFYKHCFNNGAISVISSQNRYLELANMIDKAIVAESARWGDTQATTPYGNNVGQPNPLDDVNHDLYPPAPNGPDYYFTREDSWIVERDNVIDNYIPAIHDTSNSFALINILRAANLYPDTAPPAFRINGTKQHGGYISTGDSLTMTNPNSTGTIYYSLDGTDPRVPAVAIPGFTQTLVEESAEKKAIVPTGDIGYDWTGAFEPYDETGWIPGTGGVGYEAGSGYAPYIGIDVLEMRGKNETCYIRIPFDVTAEDLSKFNSLSLNVRYDDAFVAYINGFKVYSTTNAPETLTWNSGPSDDHPDSVAKNLEKFDISEHLNLIEPGENILAIHGLNYQLTSSDFLISAELVAGDHGTAAGGISDSAQEYTTPIDLQYSRNIKARILKGNEWSPLADATFAVGPVAQNLRITEIMYHPADPNHEFLEIQNIGTQTINLNLVRFTKGIDFTFPAVELAPSDYILLVRNQAKFEELYGAGLPIIGQFEGTDQLDKNGENIRLRDAANEIILEFEYKDGWYDITDGDGFSLTIIDPLADTVAWSTKDNWRPSSELGGSPGEDDSAIVPEPGSVVLNEILAHSHAIDPDWIELHNTTGAAINIGGWYLSDSGLELMKYRIADGVSIAANGYYVFYEDVHFNNPSDEGTLLPFALSENGETVYLSSALDGTLTGYSDREDFGPSETNVAFGRYQKSTGTFNFVAMSQNTPQLPNAYPKVGPIVISEIMYHPQTNPDAEYIELLNIEDHDVTLYDYNSHEPWKITDDGNFEYFFAATPITMTAGERILLIKNQAAFDSEFAAEPGTRIFEWSDGSLSNGGERIELSMPGDIDILDVRQYIRIDRVNYDDETPWPEEADGEGWSLVRENDESYGNDPANWNSAAPTPGGITENVP